MNIVYVSNDAYAQHLGVSLCSLYDSNEDEEQLQVFVLDTGISADSRKKLRSVAKSFGRQLTFCPLGDLKSRIDADTGRFDLSTMGRLFVGELLPGTVDRVLYLDCDTVVLRSLKGLWETELRGAVMAAVQEPTIYDEVKQYLGMSRGDPYYNAGVLLIDLERWRREGLRDQVLSYYAGIADLCLFNDQDALNGLLKGRIRDISPRYNFFTNYRYFRYETLCRMQPAYRKIRKEAFLRAKRTPSVIHYAGDERPWKAGSLNYYGKAYELYLSMTPWRGAPKEKGSELMLLAYHGMDLMTLVCPAARAFVSKAYIRKCIAERRARVEERKNREDSLCDR